MADFVDLTSPDDAPAQQQQRKRRRPAGETIDLAADVDDSSAAAAAAAAEEVAAARCRIMDHARRVNQERGIAAEGLHHAGDNDGSRGGGSGGSGPAAAAQDGPHGGSLPAPNRLLADLHAERMARQAQRQRQQPGHQGQGQQAAAPSGDGWQPGQQPGQQPPPALQQQQQQQQGEARVSLLTWNVWFKEEIHVEARMAAIGAVVQARQPTFVCLQEVTPRIYNLFRSTTWWPAYHASPCPPGAPYFTLLLWSRGVQGTGAYAEIPFENSCMGRDLKTVAGRVAGRSIRVATTHLESPVGWDQPFREARQAQLRQAAALMDKAREEDVLLAGDMNWSPDDGVPPLPGGWSDAYIHLHGARGEEDGLTYDARANPMLKKGNRLRRRLDRIFCKLRRWRLAALEMVGKEALPGLQYEGRPVLPSDHFGLVLELRPTSE